MKKSIICKTLWMTTNKNEGPPHGWGVTPPFVSFINDSGVPWYDKAHQHNKSVFYTGNTEVGIYNRMLSEGFPIVSSSVLLPKKERSLESAGLCFDTPFKPKFR